MLGLLIDATVEMIKEPPTARCLLCSHPHLSLNGPVDGQTCGVEEFGVMGVALLAEGDTANARSTFAAGVIATTTGGTAVIYQVDRWKLSLQSAIHFGIMVCTVLPALFLSGWFALDTPLDYLTVIGIFLVAGLVIWLVMFLVFEVILPKRRSRRESSAA